MFLRRESVSDREKVGVIVGDAFGKNESEPIEVGLLERLRLCDGWIPELSLVAVRGDQIVGHAICTRGTVGGNAGLGLGPIAVRPAEQRQGVGSALMHSMLGAADARGEPFVALLGNPDFYSKFGFVASTDHGIQAPEAAWGSFFQVRTLTAFDQTTSGRFEYAHPFRDLND